MKRLIFCSMLLLGSYGSFAQLKVNVKTFDLESIKKNNGWNLFSGKSTSDGNVLIKLGKPNCDQTTSAGTVTTYGVAWDFEELIFDKDLNLLKSNPKSFSNSAEAMQYESVWGKTYNASNMNLGGSGSLENLTSEDFGKMFVMPTSAVTGLKISLTSVESEVKTVMNAKGTAAIGCNQYPTLKVLSSESIKEQKGQKWMHIKSYPGQKSCVSLFQVDGEGFAKGKMNYVLKRINGNLETEKSLTLEFDYNNALQIAEFKNKAGNKDYVIISQTSDKYAPKGCAVKAANFAEVIYVDGSNLEVKARESFQLPYSKWYVREAVMGDDGSVFVFGPAGKDNKSYLEMPGSMMSIADVKSYKNIVNDPKNSPNLLVLKVKNNKVAGITANTVEDAKKVTQIIGGSSKKSKGIPVFNYPSTPENANVFSVIRKNNRRVYCKNDKVIVIYQAHLEGSTSKPPTFGDMTIAVIDNSGKIEKMFLLPESDYSNYEEYFSEDNSKLYWITYDYLSLNKQTLGPGVYEAKKVPNTIAVIPQLSVIDLTKLTATDIQNISSEEWGIDAKNPVIANTEKEIIFQGKSAAKKAKDSELVLIRVEK
jgi:hypothetical protein